MRGWQSLAVAGALLAGTATAGFAKEEGAIYELRTYTTAPGKLPVLLERFGRSNLPLFEKHGIELVGAWTPVEQGDQLIYLLRFPSRDAVAKAREAFGSDPDWKALFAKEKEEHGEVVAKVESVFLSPTDYSPEPGVASEGEPSLYEMRTYTASPGRLVKLNDRFREHTLELFARHGMRNIVYTVPADEDKGSANTLVYIVAHKDRASADASWKAFGDDPEWQKVYAESQTDGVKLAEKVERIYLSPTAFSPLK